MHLLRLSPLIALLSLLSIAQATTEQIENFWFNGAEINRYALDQNRYGSQHPGHAEFIFVTEPFLLDQQVKHEFGSGTSTPVLKLNALRTFNTGIYSYRTMTSTFQPIDLETYPHAFKSNTSVQDWCGQAFQQINRQPNGWAFELRSYFQNEADQNRLLPDAILEDALWLLIRLKPEALPTGQFKAIPGAVFTRFKHETVTAYEAEATLEREAEGSRYTVSYPRLQRVLVIEFDNTFPHIIRKWSETSPRGTTTATLEDRIMHSNYWEQNAPGDAPLRKKLGLAPIPD